MAKPDIEKLRKASRELLVFAPPPSLPQPLPDGGMDRRFAEIPLRNIYKSLSLVVIDFKSAPPKTFMYREQTPWDIGSAGKLGVAAAALVLRRDVQALRAKGIIMNLSEADDIMQHVWSVSDKAKIRAIGLPGSFPVPSTVLEWEAGGVLFIGERLPDDFNKLRGWTGKNGMTPENLPKTTFWERLMLMTKQSDNRAARAVQGAVGLRYINHSLEALELYFPKTATGFRPAGSYGSGQRYRNLGGLRQPKEFWNGWIKAYIGSPARVKTVPYAATAHTLATLMIAVFTDKFIDPNLSFLFRQLLKDEPGFTSTSKYVFDGAKQLLDERTYTPLPGDALWSKLGYWKTLTDFVRIDVAGLRYGVIVLGLPPTWRGPDSGATVAMQLGRFVLERLEAPLPPPPPP